MIAHFNLVDGKPTLWDKPQGDSVPLEVVIKDGKVSMAMSAHSLATLQGLLDYCWVDEERSYEEWVDAHGPDAPESTGHIFHNIKHLQELFG